MFKKSHQDNGEGVQSLVCQGVLNEQPQTGMVKHDQAVPNLPQEPQTSPDSLESHV